MKGIHFLNLIFTLFSVCIHEYLSDIETGNAEDLSIYPHRCCLTKNPQRVLGQDLNLGPLFRQPGPTTPPPHPPLRHRQAGFARLDDRRNMQGMHQAIPTGSTNWIPLAFFSPAGGHPAFPQCRAKNRLDNLSLGFFELL